MNQYLILVDIGGTFLKISKVNIQTDRIKNFKKYPMPEFIKNDSVIKELDPQRLLSMCISGVKELLENEKNVIGIYITGQMGGWVATDKQNNPMTNLITWQDQRIMRVENQYEKTLDCIYEELGSSWKMDSGNEVRPGLPIISLIDYLESNASSNDLRFHSLISWVTSKMCDRSKYVLNDTDFASTGLYNLRTKDLNFLEKYKKRIEFPKIVNEVIVIGYFKLTRIPVYSCVGDQQASLLGSGMNSNSLVVNIGTGGQVAKLGSLQEVGPNQVRPYFDGRFIITKTHLPSGRNISLFLEKILKRSPIDEDFIFISNIEIDEFSPAAKELRTSNLWGENKIAMQGKNLNEIKKFLRSLSEIYVNSLKEIATKDESKILFAGGIGQKIVYIQQYIANSLDMDVSISDTAVTTLQGLFELGKSQNER
jgi:xylulokinase